MGLRKKMKKSSLRKFLNSYYLIIESVKEKRRETELLLYGRRKRISIPDWCWRIEEIFQKITVAENNFIVNEIIDTALSLHRISQTVIIRTQNLTSTIIPQQRRRMRRHCRQERHSKRQSPTSTTRIISA